MNVERVEALLARRRGVSNRAAGFLFGLLDNGAIEQMYRESVEDLKDEYDELTAALESEGC
ncbi:MAG TPA: hypothetical protein VGR90_04545 [Acidimicrobiales bacterium]|nr:hypothetical protein [Acidimicrobiales bacterium]